MLLHILGANGVIVPQMVTSIVHSVQVSDGIHFVALRNIIEQETKSPSPLMDRRRLMRKCDLIGDHRYGEHPRPQSFCAGAGSSIMGTFRLRSRAGRKSSVPAVTFFN